MNKVSLINASWIMFSNVILAISNWGQLSILTHKIELYLLGVYTLSLAISNPIFQFSNLQLRLLYVTDRDNAYNFSQYFSLRIATSIIAIIISFIIGGFIFNNLEAIRIFIFIFFLYSVDAMIDIFNARLHYEQNLIAVSRSTILRALAGFMGLYVGIYFFDNLSIGIICASMFKIIGFLFYDKKFIKNREVIRIVFDKKIFKLARWAMPMGIGLIISSLNINIAKYFINYKFGLEMQGVYSTLSYLVVIGNVFIGAIGHVIVPKLAIYFSNRELKKLQKMLNSYLLVTFFTGLLLFLISLFMREFLVEILFSSKIVKYSNYLVWIMGSSIFVYLMAALGFGLTSVNIIKGQAMLGVLALIINLVLNLIFIKQSSVESITLFFGFAFIAQLIVGLFLFNFKIKRLL